MKEFFGLSMTYIMIALLVILVVALSTVAWVLLRNRVMFLVGVRNIPRRRAQTILIIIGLMLSTLIISTAFSIGDTVDYSITNQAYARLQSIDELVQAQTGNEDNDPFSGIGSLISPLPIPEARANDFVAQFKQVRGVDGAMGVVRGAVAVSNEAKGQTEPLAILVGIPPEQLQGFDGDIETLGGVAASPADLAADEVYINESAADALDASKGDVLTVFVAGNPVKLTVKEIVKKRVLTGAIAGETNGLVVSLDRAQQLFNRPGEVDFIAVSNDGGPRAGYDSSKAVTDRLNDILVGPKQKPATRGGPELRPNPPNTPWIAATTKKDFVDAAADTASFIVTFFVILGLFSIAAGVLLIFLIFVMLAAERKMEMGMVRAVGTKRRHLIQMFMSEGMVYNVGAAAVGCALGIAVSILMVRIMASLFSGLDLGITFHVTPRSLLVSYSIGVVLTFLTVTFSSWRIGNLNIVSAIRDTPDPTALSTRPNFTGGIGGVLRFVYGTFFKPSRWRQWGIALGMIVLGVISLAVGIGLFIGAAALYGGSSFGSVVAVLLGVGGGALILTGAGLVLFGLNAIFQTGPLAVIAGIILMIVGWAGGDAFPFGLGMSLLLIGAALLLRFFGAPSRPVFTAMGVLMLFFWLLFAGNNVPGAEKLKGGPEMFFLSGVTMVVAATFVLVYNADLMLALLNVVGGFVSSLVPSIRTAVAYPLANKFRTGMTVAMISLVMFALVMFSTMNENFDRIFLSNDALGGYQVGVTENPGNPIPDLQADLRQQGFDTSGIEGVDRVERANDSVARVRQITDADGKTIEDNTSSTDPAKKYDNYSIVGMSDGFIQNNDLKFQARAEGFDSDRAVWDSIAQHPEQAIIDAFAVGGGGFGGDGFTLEGLESTDKTFKPIRIEVHDFATGASREVEIVGVLNTQASGLYGGLFITPDAFSAVFQRPESAIHLVRLNSGVDANTTAKAIEKTLGFQGVQADSLRKVIQGYQDQSRGFLYLIQGFMGIGLFVGIAAVGVIAFRTVVERRQQIGMLRAIGYSRRAIALSFIMESSFTALLGIFSGIGLGLLLANQLVKTDDFVAGGVDNFYIPWLQIGAVAGFAFLASLIMTIIPSRQASSIPIAEALRYE